MSAMGSYRPPRLGYPPNLPPQTTITLPVQTAVCSYRAVGAFTVVVGVQVSARGSYRLPVFPTQITITVPVHTAVWTELASGPVPVDVGVQVSATGSYRPPVLRESSSPAPPQTTIRLPVHTAVCR